MHADLLFVILNFGHWDLPFDWAQGGELVEPFDICFLVLVIFIIILEQLNFFNQSFV